MALGLEGARKGWVRMFSVPPRGRLQWKQASFLKASTRPPNKEVATLEKKGEIARDCGCGVYVGVGSGGTPGTKGNS